MLFLISCLGVIVYIVIIGGWSSNSNYSYLGGIRSIVQSLSYEISLFFILFRLFFYTERYRIIDFCSLKLIIIIINFPLCLIFFLRIIVDLNRIPFDFIEGESELVSGFNTEYIRGRFALFFLAEYILILILRIWISLIFFNVEISRIWFLLNVLILCNLIIFIRGRLPRIRYDKLIYLCWYEFLPIIFIILFFILIYIYYLHLWII